MDFYWHNIWDIILTIVFIFASVTVCFVLEQYAKRGK